MVINHKVSFVSVFVFLITSLTVNSQNTKIDSLKSIVETGTKDTIMVSTLNALSLEVLKENILESKVYAEQANELATQLDFKKGKANALKNIGLAAYYQGDFLAVLDYWTESLETFEVINDSIGIAKLVNNLGAVYYSQGSHPKALDYFLRSLSLSEKTQDPFNIVQALLNLGGLYAEMQDYEKALEFFNRIEGYRASLKNSDLITSYLMGEGEVYFEQGLYDDALKYYEEALTSTENITLRADNLIKLGLVEFKKGEKEKSINYLNEAYGIAKINNQQSEVIQALIGLGSVHKQDDYKKALAAYSEAEILAKEIEANDELRDIYDGMSQLYAEIGDYSNAFKYQSRYLDQKDLIFNLETDDKIRGLQFDFDLEKKEDEIGLLEKESEIQELTEKRQKNVIWVTGIFLFLVVLLAISLFRRYKFTQETNLIIENEKNRSESLLLNILPEETALELKEFGKVKAKRFEGVTVLFTDFVGFTAYAKNLEPEELVSSVDYYFSKFDAIMEKYGVEKIKTIGDAYMCAAGLPYPKENDVFRAVQAAFEISEFIEESKKTRMDHETKFDIRIGMNTGPIVAGVVGTKKFAYDIWGDSVNVASRMETKSSAGKINVSESTYALIKDVYECEYRGEIDVKNKGMMKMYFVNAVKNQSFLDNLQLKETVLVS
jgi:adenylate cyclase